MQFMKYMLMKFIIEARVFSTLWECFKEELEQIRQIILKHFPDIENGKSSLI